MKRSWGYRISSGSLATLLMLAMLFQAPAHARAYWLENGLEVPATCPGETAGMPLKVANRHADRFLITAIVMCTDTGASYKLNFEFLSVRINPSMARSIERDVVEFNWVGLAVYKAKGATEEKIDWLYDEARMIDGKLEKSSTKPVYFSNIEFDVPKKAADKATHFTFYLIWKGPLETFGVL